VPLNDILAVGRKRVKSVFLSTHRRVQISGTSSVSLAYGVGKLALSFHLLYALQTG